MNWTDLCSALALVLVIEGLWPFISPQGFKQRLSQIFEVDNQTLRVFGLVSMGLGLLALYLVRL
ncbi:MAG: DUF2065 domain-containing protein [bacterium]